MNNLREFRFLSFVFASLIHWVTESWNSGISRLSYSVNGCALGEENLCLGTLTTPCNLSYKNSRTKLYTALHVELSSLSLLKRFIDNFGAKSLY